MDPAEYAQQYLDGQQELRHDAARIVEAGLVTGAASWLWANRGRVQQAFQQHVPPQSDEPVVYVPQGQQRPLIGPVGVAVAVIVGFLCLLYLFFFVQTF
jgi:hypothetical protein